MAVNSSKDPWLEALCAGAVNSQVLLKKIYCFCIVKKAFWSLMKGKGREPLILNSFCQCWAFQHYFSFYQYFVWVKETNRSLKYQTSSRLHILTQKWYKRASCKCLLTPTKHWYFGTFSRGKIPPPSLFCLFLVQETHADVNHVFSHLLPLPNKWKMTELYFR